MHWLIVGIAAVALLFARKAKASTPAKPANSIPPGTKLDEPLRFQVSPTERAAPTSRNTIGGTASIPAIGAIPPISNVAGGTTSNPTEFYVPPGKLLMPSSTTRTPYTAPAPIPPPVNVTRTMPVETTMPVSTNSPVNVTRAAFAPVYSRVPTRYVQ